MLAMHSGKMYMPPFFSLRPISFLSSDWLFKVGLTPNPSFGFVYFCPTVCFKLEKMKLLFSQIRSMKNIPKFIK